MLRDSLSRVRVLDFSHVLAGPVCSMTLADLGADVVKIEPPEGELGRKIGPPWVNGESPAFMSVNRNKQSVAINLKTEAGRRVVSRSAVRTIAVTPSTISATASCTRISSTYSSSHAAICPTVSPGVQVFRTARQDRCRQATHTSPG